MTIELQEVENISIAEVASKEFEAIEKANSERLLVAEEVVAKASHPDNPLHKYFEWDDTIAGHQYRLAQARSLIRKVKVMFPKDDGPPVPKYVSLIEDRKREGGGYRKTEEIINSKELLAQMEADAKRDIDSVLRRYELLKDLCSMVRAALGIETKEAKKKK